MPKNAIKALNTRIDQWLGSATPTVHHHPNTQIPVQHLTQLQQPYRPTPWLPNTHMQLFFFDLFRKKHKFSIYDHRDTLRMSDGGTTELCWVNHDLPAHTPTIVVLHTITGTPDSMQELISDVARDTGWRVVLCLRRGHAHLPLTSAKISLFGCTQDLKSQLQFIQQRFPQSPLYAIGSSAGSGLLVRYLGEHADQVEFKAAFAYCPGYNTDEAFEKALPFYDWIMTKKLKAKFVTRHLKQLQSVSNLSTLQQAKSLAEFQANMYELAGFSSATAYADAINPMGVFERVSIPLMILNAQDDPVCNIDNVQPYLSSMTEMKNVTLVVTPKGSHCAYYEGWRATSWAHRLMADFFLKMHAQSPM